MRMRISRPNRVQLMLFRARECKGDVRKQTAERVSRTRAVSFAQKRRGNKVGEKLTECCVVCYSCVCWWKQHGTTANDDTIPVTTQSRHCPPSKSHKCELPRIDKPAPKRLQSQQPAVQRTLLICCGTHRGSEFDVAFKNSPPHRVTFDRGRVRLPQCVDHTLATSTRGRQEQRNTCYTHAITHFTMYMHTRKRRGGWRLTCEDKQSKHYTTVRV